MAIAGHFSATAKESKAIGIVSRSALIFDYRGLDGEPYLKLDGKPFYRAKPDWNSSEKAKALAAGETLPKYLSQAGNGCRPYFSRSRKNWEAVAKSIKLAIVETEGEKTTDKSNICGSKHGFAVIGFGGVDSWRDHSPRSGEVDRRIEAAQEQLSNLHAAKPLDREEIAKAQGSLEKWQSAQGKESLPFSRSLPELEAINYVGRSVFLCFDSDVATNSKVQVALQERAKCLKDARAEARIILLPTEMDGSKNGLDDFLVRHGEEAFLMLKKFAIPALVSKGKGKSAQLALNPMVSEPDIVCKSIMAWSVLKEKWAYRPNLGFYVWRKTHWEREGEDSFNADATAFCDAQTWRERGVGVTSAIAKEVRNRLTVCEPRWNPDSLLIFSNGSFDVRSEEFRGCHRSQDYCTATYPYDFSPSALCPNWDRFLGEATGQDPELINLLRAWMRWAIAPKPNDRKFKVEKSLDLFGKKGTGKGTFLQVLCALVGDGNFASIESKSFNTPESLGDMIDKKIAVDFDAQGFLAASATMQKIISNEPVPARKLYKDGRTERLGIVLIRAYNGHVSVPAGAEGLDRRLCVVSFDVVPEEVDGDLGDKLLDEMPGIFAWAWSLEEADAIRSIRDSGSLASVQDASISRFQDNNPEYRFLLEKFPYGADRIPSRELYQQYVQWNQDVGCTKKSETNFATGIQLLGCHRKKERTANTYSIPNMEEFDVPKHLGIVKRDSKSEKGGGCGTSVEGYVEGSNLYTEPRVEGVEPLSQKFIFGLEKEGLEDVNGVSPIEGEFSPPNPPHPPHSALGKGLNPPHPEKQPSTPSTPALGKGLSQQTGVEDDSQPSTPSTARQKLAPGVRVRYLGDKHRIYSPESLVIDSIDEGAATCTRPGGGKTTRLPLNQLAIAA